MSSIKAMLFIRIFFLTFWCFLLALAISSVFIIPIIICALFIIMGCVDAARLVRRLQDDEV